ncbi:50S ribosomal protein L24 [Candidatus Curtissbacteria bacterium]|nr:50S ribosomal protein L24 [Candidatus Curtissbacteria bacterium]
MFKFKIGDEVVVTAGRDKGKSGKVEKVLLFENKLIIAGVNIYKRHRKVTRTQAAGIYEIARPISLAKVALVCPKCGKTTRVGFKSEGNKKNRICKKCKGVI